MEKKLFKKLCEVVNLEKLKEEGYLKYVSSGLMDLNFDVIDFNKNTNQYLISIAHNFIQNGDVMADPDMELFVDFKNQVVSSRTYQLDSLGIFQEVLKNGINVNKKLKRELNFFLNGWLDNIKNQGFELKTN